jgi:hypothetical protein
MGGRREARLLAWRTGHLNASAGRRHGRLGGQGGPPGVRLRDKFREMMLWDEPPFLAKLGAGIRKGWNRHKAWMDGLDGGIKVAGDRGLEPTDQPTGFVQRFVQSDGCQFVQVGRVASLLGAVSCDGR